MDQPFINRAPDKRFSFVAAERIDMISTLYSEHNAIELQFQVYCDVSAYGTKLNKGAMDVR